MAIRWTVEWEYAGLSGTQEYADVRWQSSSADMGARADTSTRSAFVRLHLPIDVINLSTRVPLATGTARILAGEEVLLVGRWVDAQVYPRPGGRALVELAIRDQAVGDDEGLWPSLDGWAYDRNPDDRIPAVDRERVTAPGARDTARSTRSRVLQPQ